MPNARDDADRMTWERDESPTSRQRDRKRDFIRLLALYLADDFARKKAESEMGNRWAEEWAAMRLASPVVGGPTVREAIEKLTEFLS